MLLVLGFLEYGGGGWTDVDADPVGRARSTTSSLKNGSSPAAGRCHVAGKANILGLGEIDEDVALLDGAITDGCNVDGRAEVGYICEGPCDETESSSSEVLGVVDVERRFDATIRGCRDEGDGEPWSRCGHKFLRTLLVPYSDSGNSLGIPSYCGSDQ